MEGTFTARIRSIEFNYLDINEYCKRLFKIMVNITFNITIYSCLSNILIYIYIVFGQDIFDASCILPRIQAPWLLSVPL